MSGFNDPSFSVKLYAAFADSSEVYGADILCALSNLCNKNRVKQISAKPLFECTVRVSSKENIPGLKCI